jgi:hypothetical protein
VEQEDTMTIDDDDLDRELLQCIAELEAIERQYDEPSE